MGWAGPEDLAGRRSLLLAAVQKQNLSRLADQNLTLVEAANQKRLRADQKQTLVEAVDGRRQGSSSVVANRKRVLLSWRSCLPVAQQDEFCFW